MPSTITLTSESDSIQYLCKKDKGLAKVISLICPISYQPYRDDYEFWCMKLLNKCFRLRQMLRYMID